jgi:phospholipid/cholesterol/gamma-HCH transport system permease protein
MTSGTALLDAPPRQRSNARIVSRARVLFGSIYWLVWIIFSRRAVVTTGIARELESLGTGSLRLVGLSSILVGLITTFQVAYQLSKYGAEAVSGQAVGWFAWRELGPIVVAVLVVSRSASAITGELAAMSANAEIDALRAMGLDPIKYLITPKLGALLIAIPGLTILADGLIALGGWIGSTFFLRFNTLLYLEELRSAVAMRDFYIGIAKSIVFALIITVEAADEGLNADRRVGSIGAAASRSVVYCLLGVLAADTFVNAIFYFIPTLVY